MDMPLPTLPDYPTANLAEPGRYPHRILPGRLLVIEHEGDPEAEPPSLEDAAANEGWADWPAGEIECARLSTLERLAAWQRGEWHYLGVIVTIYQTWGTDKRPRAIGSSAVWSVESDAGPAYLAMLALEEFHVAQAEVIALGAALNGGYPTDRRSSKADTPTA
jgi:hypothetical protein